NAGFTHYSLFTSIIPETLLQPWIAAEMVAAVIPLLPKTGPILIHKLNPAHPFGAFPGVEPGDHQAQRVAVIRLQGLTIVPPGKQAVLAQEIRQRQVGGETLLAMDHDKFRRAFPSPLG